MLKNKNMTAKSILLVETLPVKTALQGSTDVDLSQYNSGGDDDVQLLSQ